MPILRVGQRLGPYVVSGLVGQGGMAEVYRATHQALEREVAIKVLNPKFMVDPTFPLRFRREAKASARLSHPNIVAVYDFDERGEIAYLVMELATGGTFDDRARRFVTLADVLQGLEPIFAAVHYAHTSGIVHRDLKPENVLLTQADRPLLADFGLARIQSESLDIDEIDMILGTPYYMAPEQVRAEDVDPRADIYALGILTYALVTGQVPFDGADFPTIARQHLQSPPPSVRAVLPDAPLSLDEAIRTATAKDRADRYATAEEFLDALRRAVAEAPTMRVGIAALMQARRAGLDADADATGGQPPPATQSQQDGPQTSGAQTVALGPNATGASQPPPTARGPEAWSVGSEGCPECGAWLRPTLRFCTNCGNRVSARSSTVVAAAAPSGLPPASISELTDGGAAGGAVAAGRAGTAGGALGVPLTPARRTRRRATSFTRGQWIALGIAAAVVLFINGVGWVLTRWGRSVGAEAVASGVLTYIYDHLPWFKSGMTLIGLILAACAVYSMRVVVIEQRQRAPELYRRLRQYHRLWGYGAFSIAVAIGALTCIGIFGFDVSTPRRAIHTTVGSALLLALAGKIVVVRHAARYRRYLLLIGVSVLALYALTFITSAGVYTWQQITNPGNSGYAP